MPRLKTVTLGDITYKLQSITGEEYMRVNNRYGQSGNKATDDVGYRNYLLKNCVLEPKEVAEAGLSYFNVDDDIAGAYALVGAIETFLGEPKKPRESKRAG